MKRVFLLCLFLLVAGFLNAADFAIAIDAAKDEFYTTLTGPTDGWIHIPFEANNNNGTWAEHDDEYDLSANFFCAWDDTYFYFYEEVWDDEVACIRATNYENDCMELKFDPDPLMGAPTSGSGVYAMRITAFDSSDFEGELSGVDNMYPEGNTDITGFRYVPGEDYARAETELGYNVEGRIPWEHIYFTQDARGPVTAAAGNIFGMAVMNHENDYTEGRYGSIEWASHMDDAVWNNVNLHGTVTFLEGNKLSLSTMNTITGIDTNTINYTPQNVGVAQKLLAPVNYTLAQNYPNPFNPLTTIEFTLPHQAQVTVKVFDLLGNEIAILVDELKTAGRHSVVFDGMDHPSGVYLYQINNGQEILTKKMMLIK
ncbi:MAG: T9SS C-terminal target domain-containing protein [Calditrichaeota bacterium]|nr:MAG: T9SS C-terminal target domain-containing protein [Calditrichota bacterium]